MTNEPTAPQITDEDHFAFCDAFDRLLAQLKDEQATQLVADAPTNNTRS